MKEEVNEGSPMKENGGKNVRPNWCKKKVEIILHYPYVYKTLNYYNNLKKFVL